MTSSKCVEFNSTIIAIFSNIVGNPENKNLIFFFERFEQTRFGYYTVYRTELNKVNVCM